MIIIWWWQGLGRLVVNKQRLHRFYMEKFNLKKLNEVEAKEKYHVEVSNKFAAWIIGMLRWILIVLGKRLEYKNFSQTV
jgi:hypothetical protein